MEDKKEDLKPSYKLTNRQLTFLAALKNKPTNVAEASERCKISRYTHYAWMNEKHPQYNPDYKSAVEEMIEKNLDHLESELDFRIDGQYTLRVDEKGNPALDAAGNQIRDYINPPDNTLLKFKLLTKGKHRGYVYRQEVTGADSNPLFGGFEVNIKKK